MHSDGEHFHFVWGPGRVVEAPENEEYAILRTLTNSSGSVS
jgi:hypothetical protein